jgi:hypothetical protein
MLTLTTVVLMRSHVKFMTWCLWILMNVLTKIFSDTILEGKVLLTAATSRIYLLMMATVVMYRSTAHKVLPAMYIENVTQLAFDDVSAEDQDFAFIQGLAEAGLIWSNLSTNDVKKIGKDSRVCFEPDRYCDLLNMS